MAKDLMSKEIVMFDVDAKDRNEVINLIADAMDKDGRLIDKEGYVADVMKREAGSSTAVGFSVANVAILIASTMTKLSNRAMTFFIFFIFYFLAFFSIPILFCFWAMPSL